MKRKTNHPSRVLGILLLSIFLILGSLVWFACENKKNVDPKNVVAKYKDIPLMREELVEVVPKTMNSTDSILYVQMHIRNWMLNRILEQEAERNLNMDDINKQVDEYRRELLRYYYLKELTDQKINIGKADDSDIFDYYVKNGDNYTAKSNYIKYAYIKLLSNDPQLSALRKDMKEADLEAIEEFASSNQLEYQLEDSAWIDVKSVSDAYPFLVDGTNKLEKDKYIEFKKDQSVILFRILDYCAKGSKPPLELIESEIKNILKNKRKKEFIDNFEDKIYKDNVANGNIVIY